MERQVGEITGTLRAFHEDLGELKSTMTSLADSQREAAADRRFQQQLITQRLENLERTTSNQHSDNSHALQRLTDELTGLKEPVGQFISIRKRAGTVLMIVLGVGSVVWTLAEPIYQFLVARFFGTH
jgi:Flp pilus assembly protein TadB